MVQRKVREFIATPRANDDACWLWPGAAGRDGYGSAAATVNGVRRRGMVHRLVYVLTTAPVPAEMVLDHLCRNRACCRPSHLEPVTQHENVQRSNPVQKAHCIRGHLYTPETLIPSNLAAGRRACRVCSRERAAARRAQRRVAA